MNSLRPSPSPDGTDDSPLEATDGEVMRPPADPREQVADWIAIA
ncbi:hypothetical protein [Nonomuraea sp. NPDC050310]